MGQLQQHVHMHGAMQCVFAAYLSCRLVLIMGQRQQALGTAD